MLTQLDRLRSFTFFINKNGKVLDFVDYKHQAGVVECRGKEVLITNDAKQEFDIVIMSTGYNIVLQEIVALPLRSLLTSEH